MNVLTLRTQLGLTQAALARKLKVEPITVARWEQGVRRPDRVNIERLARLERKLAKKAAKLRD